MKAAKQIIESKLDRALALAEQGFYVFPTEPLSKITAIDNWPNRATRDPAKIRAFWTCPVMDIASDRNVAIGGSRYGDGKALLIVDTDQKDNKDGEARLCELQAEHGQLPQTRTVRTPSGGRHRYFIIDAPVANSASMIAPGIDIKSRAGYVLAPGSALPHGAYVLENDAEIAAAPDWLVSLCGGYAADRPKAAAIADNGLVATGEGKQRAIRYLKHDAPPSIEYSGGDDTGIRVAMRVVRDFGIPPTLAVDMMAEHWNPRCLPPWPLEDVQRFARQAMRSGQNAPGFALASTEFTAVEPEPANNTAAVVSPADTKQVTPLFTLNEVNIGPILRKPPQPMEMIVDSFLPANRVALLVAPGGSSKSMLGNLIGASAALCLPVAGNPCWTVSKPRHVMIVNCEDDHDEFNRRMGRTLDYLAEQQAAIPGADAFPNGDAVAAVRSRICGELEKRLFYHFPRGDDIRLVTAEGKDFKANVDRLFAALRTLPGLDLLILDPVRHLTGGVKENETAPMTGIARIATRIQTEFGCTVLLLHHVNKESQKQGSRDSWASAGTDALTTHVRLQVNMLNMTEKEAKKYGIAEADRERYVGIKGSKANGMALSKLVFLERETDSALLHYRPLTPAAAATKQEDYDIVLAFAREKLPTLAEPVSRNKFAVVFAKEIGLGQVKVRDALRAAVDQHGDLIEITPAKPQRGVPLVLAIAADEINAE